MLRGPRRRRPRPSASPYHPVRLRPRPPAAPGTVDPTEDVEGFVVPRPRPADNPLKSHPALPLPTPPSMCTVNTDMLPLPPPSQQAGLTEGLGRTRKSQAHLNPSDAAPQSHSEDCDQNQGTNRWGDESATQRPEPAR